MSNVRIRQQVSGEIVNKLLHLYTNLLTDPANLFRRYGGTHPRELLLAHFILAIYKSALHSVGPLNVSGHLFDDRLDVAVIEIYTFLKNESSAPMSR